MLFLITGNLYCGDTLGTILLGARQILSRSKVPTKGEAIERGRPDRMGEDNPISPYLVEGE